MPIDILEGIRSIDVGLNSDGREIEIFLVLRALEPAAIRGIISDEV